MLNRNIRFWINNRLIRSHQLCVQLSEPLVQGAEGQIVQVVLCSEEVKFKGTTPPLRFLQLHRGNGVVFELVAPESGKSEIFSVDIDVEKFQEIFVEISVLRGEEFVPYQSGQLFIFNEYTSGLVCAPMLVPPMNPFVKPR